MPSPTLNDSATAALDGIINKIVDDRSMPAIFLGVTSADRVLYENQGGWQDYDQPEGKRVDADTTLHLFSASKFVTSVACHILVDQGRAKMHDVKFLADILPELRQDRLQVIVGTEEDGTPILGPAEKPITLAMLLSHSAGFSYQFNATPPLQKWWATNPRKAIFDREASIIDFEHPLLFQPGSSCHYGTGHDWAGFMIERITGQPLEEALRTLIFEPVGMTSTSFIPKSDIMSRLLKPCHLDQETGKLTVLPPEPLGKAATVDKLGLHLGSAGLYGTAKDYLRFLQAVMRSSPDYAGSEKGLVSKESFKCLFTGVLTEKGADDFGSFVKGVWYHTPIGGHNASGLQHSPGLMIYRQGGECGRKPDSGCWDGALKTMYWLDPKSDIAAVCFTNIYSERNDNVVGETVRQFEREIYKGLVSS